MFYFLFINILFIALYYFFNKETFKNTKKKIQSIKKVKINLLNQCFTQKELNSFDKYKNVAKIVEKYNGIVYLTPTEYINELPFVPFSSGGCFLNNLCIDLKHRKKGNASKLISYTINQTKSMKRNYLITQVLEKNYPAINLFKKFGFVELNKGTNQYNKNYYILIKYLN